jgi:membrane-associated phospholipid phosphatase
MTTFDEAGDRILEPLRNHRATNALFGFASKVGDFSVLWHAIGLARAIGSVHRLQQALALSLALGVESLIVNQGVKKLFKRQRPTTSGDHRFDVRTPSTSSFPSGHASSATFAAIVLTSFTGVPLVFLWVVIALVVALSRVVVRIHHLSDIVGGVVTGAILGFIALPILSLIL